MKPKTVSLVTAALLGMTLVLPAQEAPPPGGEPGPEGHRPPPPLIIGALDANHDGVIDAGEIANARRVLESLDRNGDGKLTPDEFHPHPPGRPGQHQEMQGPGPAAPPPQE